MSEVADAISKDNNTWKGVLESLQSDIAGDLDNRVKSAIDEDRQWWLQRIIDTTAPPLDLKRSYFQPDGQSEPAARSSGGTEVRHPFYVSLAGTSYQVKAGTVNGIMPTLGGTALNAGTAPTGTLSLSGTQYVYLKMTVTLTSAYDYVHTATLVSVLVDDASSVPADDKSGGFYYVPLATYVAGVKTSQNISTSLTAEWCDTGLATSTANQSTEAT